MYGRGVGGLAVSGGTVGGTLAATGLPIMVTVVMALMLVSVGLLLVRRGRLNRPS